MRYSMPAGMGGPSHYLQNVGNWPMYPQMTMSPQSAMTSSHANSMDPSVLASQLSHMQISGLANVSRLYMAPDKTLDNASCW